LIEHKTISFFDFHLKPLQPIFWPTAIIYCLILSTYLLQCHIEYWSRYTRSTISHYCLILPVDLFFLKYLQYTLIRNHLTAWWIDQFVKWDIFSIWNMPTHQSRPWLWYLSQKSSSPSHINHTLTSTTKPSILGVFNHILNRTNKGFLWSRFVRRLIDSLRFVTFDWIA